MFLPLLFCISNCLAYNLYSKEVQGTNTLIPSDHYLELGRLASHCAQQPPAAALWSFSSVLCFSAAFCVIGNDGRSSAAAPAPVLAAPPAGS